MHHVEVHRIECRVVRDEVLDVGVALCEQVAVRQECGLRQPLRRMRNCSTSAFSTSAIVGKSGRSPIPSSSQTWFHVRKAAVYWVPFLFVLSHFRLYPRLLSDCCRQLCAGCLTVRRSRSNPRQPTCQQHACVSSNDLLAENQEVRCDPLALPPGGRSFIYQSPLYVSLRSTRRGRNRR